MNFTLNKWEILEHLTKSLSLKSQEEENASKIDDFFLNVKQEKKLQEGEPQTENKARERMLRTTMSQ